MKTYTKPMISINYFEDIFTTDNAVMVSYTNAAITMNHAAFNPITTINAAAARTVRVQTILQFDTKQP